MKRYLVGIVVVALLALMNAGTVQAYHQLYNCPYSYYNSYPYYAPYYNWQGYYWPPGMYYY